VPERILATLETLRDQVRDEILKDPRYLTFLALERSIHDIKLALAGPNVSAASRKIAPPAAELPISFALLLNLASASNSEDREVLWGFIRRYWPPR